MCGHWSDGGVRGDSECEHQYRGGRLPRSKAAPLGRTQKFKAVQSTHSYNQFHSPTGEPFPHLPTADLLTFCFFCSGAPLVKVSKGDQLSFPSPFTGQAKYQAWLTLRTPDLAKLSFEQRSRQNTLRMAVFVLGGASTVLNWGQHSFSLQQLMAQH